jgi:hypothetical protein
MRFDPRRQRKHGRDGSDFRYKRPYERQLAAYRQTDFRSFRASVNRDIMEDEK